MELRLLNYFLVVAREQNISKAASILHITQPTLSRAMMQLEDELKVKLFERKPHNIELTNEGILLKQHAISMISLEQKLYDDFLKPELCGNIIIACGEVSGLNHLSKLIYEFRKQYPQITFTFETCHSDTVKDKLDKGLIDIGILFDPPYRSDYHCILLAYEKWGVLLPNDHHLCDKDEIVPDDLINENLLLPLRDNIQEYIYRWMDDIPLNIIGHYDLAYNLNYIIQNHIGIAFSLESIASLKNIEFRPLKNSKQVESIIVIKKERQLSKSTQLFFDYLKENL